MPGATIDHMISVTILITALLIAMVTFNSMFASAVAYERNRQVTMKSVDLMDTLTLSSGNPANWGQTRDVLLGFGLQDPEAGGYALSPHSVARLRTSNESQLVYYSETGLYYNNLSAYFGDAILTPMGDVVNYTLASELLGVNNTFGFRLDITPTLNVGISPVPESYLKLKVEVIGSGLPLSDVTLNYYLFHVATGSGDDPIILTYSGVEETDTSGSVLLDFPSVGNENEAYAIVIYARLRGLTGIGYYSVDVLDDYPQFVVPLIQDFNEGTILIAHSWGVHEYTLTPVPDVNYNATFFALTPHLQLYEIQIDNSTGQLSHGSKDYETTRIPVSEVGILIITYREGDRLGSVMLPWGVGTLGVSASFGGDPTGYSFVATELRQVKINEISYHIKLSAWSLEG
jgi:hypothetical protein